VSLAPALTPDVAAAAAAASAAAEAPDTALSLFDTLVLGRGDLLWLLVLAPLIAGAYVWASRSAAGKRWPGSATRRSSSGWSPACTAATAW
jgi:hypothetical protein